MTESKIIYKLVALYCKKKNANYSQLSPCGHLAITDTPIIWTAAKSLTKINYRHVTEINSCYYGLLLLRTLTCGPMGVCYKGS